jgi:hypothetical protein
VLTLTSGCTFLAAILLARLAPPLDLPWSLRCGSRPALLKFGLRRSGMRPTGTGTCRQRTRGSDLTRNLRSMATSAIAHCTRA